MKSVNQWLNLGIGVASVAALAIFSYGYIKNQKKDQVTADVTKEYTAIEQSSNAQTADEMANKYMKELQLQLQRQKLEVYKNIEVERRRLAEDSKFKNDDFTQVPIEQQITRHEQLPQGTQDFQVPVNLNARTAADFIQAARQNGYEVQLNEKYEVISIKPARVPNTARPDYDAFDSFPID